MVGLGRLIVGFMRKPWRRAYLQDHTSPLRSMMRRYSSIDAKARDRRRWVPPFWKRSMRRVLPALGLDIDYTIGGKPYQDKLFTVIKECDARDRKGRPLSGCTVADVYRVIVEIHGDANGKLPGGEGYISGKIFLTKGGGTKPAYVYKQDGHRGQYIKKGEHELLMTAKPYNHHFLSCSDPAYLAVDLCISTTSSHNHIELEEGKYVRIHNFEDDFNKDDKIDLLYLHPRYLDSFRGYAVTSSDDTCSVTVLFALFFEAVQAHVEVFWLGGENKSETGVYGLIAAKIDMSDTEDGDTNNDVIDNDDARTDDPWETILFLKEDSSQSVQVISGEAIKLSRSSIAVPVEEKLVIRAHLRCKSKLFPAAKLAFPPERSGTSELTVDGIFKVKVTWTCIMDLPECTERYLIDNRLL